MIHILVSLVALMAEPFVPSSYTECTRLVEEDAAAGLERAERWAVMGGGRAAEHCAAVAHLALGHETVAGAQLSALAATEALGDPGLAARLYLQSAEAYAAGGHRADSLTALDAAYAVAPGASEVHMTAATVGAQLRAWEVVVRALDGLEASTPLSPDAYALRGRAHYELGQIGNAGRDAAAALADDPYLVDALVLRGDVRNAGGPPGLR